MIDMHSKYDSMHKNELFYALISINNHVIFDEAFYAVVKAHKLRSNKIYKSELTMTKI